MHVPRPPLARVPLAAFASAAFASAAFAFAACTFAGCGAEDGEPAKAAKADASVADAEGAGDSTAGDVGAGDGSAGDGAGIGDAASTDATTKDAGTSTSCTPEKCAESEGSPDVCKAWTCDAAGKCLATVAADGAKCDDALGCTSVTTCQAGKCVGKNELCPCMPGDLGACWSQYNLAKDNLCTGVPACVSENRDGTKFYTCAIKPGSVVTCDSKDDTQCLAAKCAPKTGICALQSVEDGTSCEDGIACTKVDVCKGGKCEASAPADGCYCSPSKGVAACYNKLNVDPTNKCEAEVFCEATVDPATKLIDYACKAKPDSAVVCDPKQATACTSHLCEPSTGACVFKAKPDGKTPCDDSDACTANDACDGGLCVGGVKICSCQKNADCAAKEDGNACTGTLICDVKTGSCVTDPATVITCPNTGGGPCVRDYCDKLKGVCKSAPAEQFLAVVLNKMVKTPSGEIKLVKDKEYVEFKGKKMMFVPCTDGNACTVGDECVNGACQTQPTNICKACKTDAECAKHDDGSLCTGVLACVAGKCEVKKGSIPPKCSGPVAGTCLIDACAAKTGSCAKVSFAAACDDKNDCTADSCGADTKSCVHTPVTSGAACYTWGAGAGQCDAKGLCVVQ